MGTKLSDIVVVNITRQTARISRVGFGTTLIHDKVSQFQERSRTFSEPDDLLDVGFIVTDVAYIAALKLYGQERSPAQFKVGRKLEDVNDLQTTTIDALASAGTYTITIGALTTAAIAYDATVAQVKAALELLASITEVTVVGELDSALIQTIEFTGADANTEFATVSYDVSALTGVTTATVVHTQWGSGVETWAASYAAVKADDEDFYGYITETHVKADIVALAPLVEADDTRLYFAATADADVLTGAGGNVAETLKAQSYDQTALFYLGTPAAYGEGAVASFIVYDPGSLTWKFQTLVGVTPDVLNATQLTNLNANNCNYYETVAPVDTNMISSEGIVVSGEFIDIIWGTHWLQQRIAEDIFIVKINNLKVPFTNPGIGLIEGAARNRLSIASEAPYNLLVGDSIVVDFPLRSEVAAGDRAARFYRTGTFSAEYQGAIHKTRIDGKISA